jgi:hypothetical protein
MRLELAYEVQASSNCCSNENVRGHGCHRRGQILHLYVRADNMSQAFDCALMRTSARNSHSYVEVLTAQELHEPVDVYIRPAEVSPAPVNDMHDAS